MNIISKVITAGALALVACVPLTANAQQASQECLDYNVKAHAEVLAEFSQKIVPTPTTFTPPKTLEHHKNGVNYLSGSIFQHTLALRTPNLTAAQCTYMSQYIEQLRSLVRDVANGKYHPIQDGAHKPVPGLPAVVAAAAPPPPTAHQLTVNLPAGSGGQVRDQDQNIRCGDDSPAGYSAKCSFRYPKGTVVSLYYRPKEGMTWGGWTGACADQRDYCKVTMTADMTVSTSFKTVGTWKLNMTAPNGGSIIGQGFICPGTCTKDITLGANANLYPQPALGYVFEAWTGACAGQGACVVAAGNTGIIGATFKNIGTATVTVTQPVLGQIRDNPQNIRCGDDDPAGASSKCSFVYTKGELVKLYYSVKTGHSFVGWTGACANSGAYCTLTADGDKTLSATFK